MLIWDKESPHANFFEKIGKAVLLRGGYISAKDYWIEDRHSSELETTWGEFGAIKIVKSRSGRVVEAFSDPAGSWPLYFSTRGAQTLISNDPHFCAVALGLSTLDAQTVFEILKYSHPVGDGTTISGVKRLFPGQRIHISIDSQGSRDFSILKGGGYCYERELPDPNLTFNTLLDATHSLPATLKDSARAKVQISGGLDSRLTAAVLGQVLSGPVASETILLKDSAEGEIAATVAERLGFRHQQVALPPSDLKTMRAGWSLTGGQATIHAASTNLLSYGNPLGNELHIYGGWPGDCLIGSYVPPIRSMLRARTSKRAVKKWCATRGTNPQHLGVRLSGANFRAIQSAASQALLSRIHESSGATAAQKISFWAMFYRQPAFSYVSPAHLTRGVLAVTPLLARPYLLNLMKLSASDIVNKNFYRHMIYSALPELRGIHYHQTGLPIDPSQEIPSILPRALRQFFYSLPAIAQLQIRRLIDIRRRFTSDTEEEKHWTTVYNGTNFSRSLDLDGLRVDVSKSRSVSIIGAFLAMAWTRDYLLESSHLLDNPNTEPQGEEREPPEQAQPIFSDEPVG